MIEWLFIENLILIESVKIHFHPGLNIITGETGAGKSALLTAFRLLAGEKGDLRLIRQGASKAIVEAKIDGTLYRREIRGKKSPSPPLLIVDQSLSLSLRQESYQRQLLDTFGQSPSIEAFVLEASRLKTLLIDGQKKESEKERRLAHLEQDLEAIQALEPSEEELAAEHAKVVYELELTENLASLSEQLDSAPLRSPIETLRKIDPSLAHTLKEAALAIEEVSRSVAGRLASVNPSLERLAFLEEKIGQWEKLKKRLGPHPLERKEEIAREIQALQSFDLFIIQQQAEEAEKRALQAANELTALRKKEAPRLAKRVLEELINLPHARFQIDIQEAPLSSNGQDEITFLFSANPGHPLLPLSQVASGGELSRLLLALQTAIADRSSASTLILDEIDANVGGLSASLLGTKLAQLAKKKQVIAVTHFVQVAKAADRHFLVAKQEATTFISPLEDRQSEYQRMLGIQG